MILMQIIIKANNQLNIILNKKCLETIYQYSYIRGYIFNVKYSVLDRYFMY